MIYRFWVLIVSFGVSAFVVLLTYLQFKKGRLDRSYLAKVFLLLLGVCLMGASRMWQDYATLLSTIGYILMFTALILGKRTVQQSEESDPSSTPRITTG